MLKEQIREYVNNKAPTTANLRAFCIRIFDFYTASIPSLYKTRIQFVVLPGIANASVWINNRKRKATIFCNLFNVMNCKLSAGLMYFHLCTSVLHELEHLCVLSKMQASCSKTNPFSMALCEQIVSATDDFLSKYIHALFSRWSRSFGKGVHMSSSIELLCMERSHSIAIDLFTDILEDNDFNQISQLYQAISLMEQCNEIKYVVPSWPVYKFAHIFAHLQRRISKRPEMLDMYPSLRCIFSSAGQLLSVNELCDKALDEKNSFYTQIIWRLFLEEQHDVEKQLRNNSVLFSQIECISNAYCQLCIDFVKNKQLCLKWFDKSLVEDNAAMMIKNYIKLESQMKKAGMRQYSGRIFPMYLVR